MSVRFRIHASRTALAAGIVLAGLLGAAAPAAAQLYAPFGFYERRPRAPTVSPEDVYFIVRRDGYHRIGRPSFRGDFYVVDATNDDDERVRLLVDGFYGRIIEGRLLGPDAGEVPPPRSRQTSRQAARQAGEPDLTVPAPLGGAPTPAKPPKKAARPPAKTTPAVPTPATASAPPVTPAAPPRVQPPEAPPVPPAPIPNVPAASAPVPPAAPAQPPVANAAPPPPPTAQPLAPAPPSPAPKKEQPPRAAAATRAKPPAAPVTPPAAAPAKATLGTGTQANPRKIDLAPAPQDDLTKAKPGTPAPAAPPPINSVPVAPLE